MPLTPVRSAPVMPESKRPASPRTTRITVNLPALLVDRLRNTVYGLPHVTLARLVETAIHSTLKQLETDNGGPFPKRARELKPGRPKVGHPTPHQVSPVCVVLSHPVSRQAVGFQASQQIAPSATGESAAQGISESLR